VRALPLLLLVAVALPAGPLHAQPLAPADPGDVVVAQDTAWTGLHVVAHDLVVRANATLRLEGATVRVGDRILVERGARLEMHPANGTATDIGPVDTAKPDEAHGFWIQVNGTAVSSGTPATEVHGLRGSGLNNLFFPGGGLRVAGQADLADLHLSASNATLLVMPGGRAVLERGHVEAAGFLSVGTHGNLSVRNSTLEGSPYGVMGRSPCSQEVLSTRIVALTQALQDNSCPLHARDDDLTAGVTAMYLSGGVVADLAGLRVQGYTQTGLFAQMLPDEANPRAMANPRITLDGASFHPAALGAANSVGLQASGATVDVRNVTVAGHRIGILAKDESLLRLTGSAILDNRAVGVLGQDVRVAGDLLAGNRFDGNGAAVDVVVAVQAAFVDDYGRALAGTGLRILGPDGKTVAQAGPSEGVAPLQAHFFLYNYTGGAPRFGGPYTYELDHVGIATARGPVDLASPLIQVTATPDRPGGAWAGLLPGFIGIVGAALIVAAFVPWRRLRRGLRRTMRP